MRAAALATSSPNAARSSEVAENLDGKITPTQRKAGGYRNQDNLETNIYFCCGGLRLCR